MTPVAQVRALLRTAHAELAELQTRRAPIQQQLDAMLANTVTSGSFGFDAMAVRDYRSKLAAIDARGRDLSERIAALESQLPSSTEIAAGRVQCSQLQATLEAEEQARCRRAQIALADSVARFGLESERPVPHLFSVGRVEAPLAKLAHYQALVIRDAVSGAIDEQVSRERRVAGLEAGREEPAA